MRNALISFIAIVGCTAVVSASPKGSNNSLLMPGTAKTAGEAALLRPLVALEQLVDETPDGAHVIGVYQAARTVADVEAANAKVRTQVTKAQTIASDVARLHAAAIKSCEYVEASQIDAIALKARAFSTTLVRVDGELTKSLSAMRQKVEAQRPASMRAKEDVNRLVLATHEVGRLRVQAQEIAKSVEALGSSMRTKATSCTSTPLPPLFAEHVMPSSVPPPARRSPSFSTRRALRPASPPEPRFP